MAPHSHLHSHIGVVHFPREFLLSDLPRTVNFPKTFPVKSGDFLHPQFVVCPLFKLPVVATQVPPQSHLQSHRRWPCFVDSICSITTSLSYLLPIRFSLFFKTYTYYFLRSCSIRRRISSSLHTGLLLLFFLSHS